MRIVWAENLQQNQENQTNIMLKLNMKQNAKR